VRLDSVNRESEAHRVTDAKLPGTVGWNSPKCEPDLFRPSTSLVCQGPVNSGNTQTQSFAVDLKFRKKTWKKVPLAQAISLVYGFIDAEKKACYRLVYKINQDQWYVSYWAELLGFKDPPSQQEWSEALMETIHAESALKQGKAALAKTRLLSAVKMYNAAATKWVDYKGGIEKGAERGKLFIEISIIVLSTMVTGGVGNAIRATGWKGLAAKSGIAAGGSAYTTTATEVGKVIAGVEKEIDVAKIVGNTLTAFFTSIASGALADKFLSTFSDRFWLDVLKNPELVAAYKAANVMLPKVSALKVFLIEMLKSSSFNIAGSVLNDAVQKAIKQSQGKQLSMKAFLTLVASQCAQQGLADILAKHVALKAR